jgi:phenylalanyl-tRNA synthetase beta chain
MKFTLSWLKKFLDTNVPLEEICNALTSLGLEVESVTDHSKELDEFIIAEIINTEPHPNADRLKLCQVNNGKEILNIVCAATNARQGIKVVLAELGTAMPKTDIVIRKTKIRGIESNGMLCSAEELGIQGDAQGIIELPTTAKIGEKFLTLRADLTDPVIELSITPNRGDCLGVYGIARDLAAKGIGKLKPLPIVNTKPTLKQNPVKVKIEDKEGCQIFTGRYFNGVKNCESPKWLQDLFNAIGEKPISALVDITNYISYSFGRPLHVFDAEKIHGTLTIRKALTEEKFDALNEKTYTLEGGETIIADDEKVLALGGIMGGSSSGCSLQTKEVFLESALFNRQLVSIAGRKHSIDSDARHKFERGLDPQFIMLGSEIASDMIIEICGGSYSEFVVVGSIESAPKTIVLDVNKICSLSGLSIDLDTIKNILSNLGFKHTSKGENLEIIVPSWRNDINISEDLIEEILRVYGYDKIESLKLPTNSLIKPILTKQQKTLSQVRRALVASGLNEAVTWSFMSSKNAQLFTPITEQLKIVNPISSDLDIMRRSILPNLIEVVQKNHNRSLQNLAFFEVGPIFSWENNQYQQYKAISGVRFGTNIQKNLYETPRNVDAFDAKKDLYLVLSIFGINADDCNLDVQNLPNYFHPTRSACIKFKGKILGYFGEIHPEISQYFDLPNNIVAFECLIDNMPLEDEKIARNEIISDFQPVLRDFAFILDESIMASNISQLIKNLDKHLIKDVHIFDVYQGKGIMPGKKSVAISVKLQAQDRTLNNEEIQKISDQIINIIKQKLNGEIRI